MRYKKVMTIFLTASMLSITGCGKEEAKPVTSENVEVVEESEAELEESEADTESESLESDESLSEDKAESEPSAEDADNMTDEEMEEQIKTDEEEAARQQEESKAVDGDYDGGGINKVTGEYDPYHDTNYGKGFDVRGQHFDNAGEAKEFAYGDAEQQQKEKEWQEANGARELTEEQQQMINDALESGKMVVFGSDGEVQVKEFGQ